MCKVKAMLNVCTYSRPPPYRRLRDWQKNGGIGKRERRYINGVNVIYNQEKTYSGLENRRRYWGGGGGAVNGGAVLGGRLYLLFLDRGPFKWYEGLLMFKVNTEGVDHNSRNNICIGRAGRE